MILAKTCYKTYDNKLLAIVEILKNWQHCLKGCKYQILVLTNYNNLCKFMDTKNLSFSQIGWAHIRFARLKNSQYYF